MDDPRVNLLREHANDLAPYTYEPLATSASEDLSSFIRILVLYPVVHRREELLRCCIKTISRESLQSQENFYEAVSYAWEDQVPSIPLFCDITQIRGDSTIKDEYNVLQISATVGALLQCLRKTDAMRYLW